MSKGALAYPIPFWLLGPLTFASGCAAMLHVLAQLAGISYLHGFDVATQTVVLAAFMGGFAAGAVIVGLRADRSQHPLRWFGLLEIGLGCFVLGAPTMTGMLGPAPSLTTHALALMALPGLLTGGAATLLVRASAHTTERGSLALGVVVGVTALGAAGAFPILAWSSVLGVALPLVAGAAAWALSVPIGKREIFASDGENIRIGWTGDAGFPVVCGFVVVGAILPVQRFAWNRLLPFALDSADPAATGFLLHLSGIGVGALAGTLLISGGYHARRLLARVLLACAVLTGAPLFYGDAFLQGGGAGAAALLVWPGAFGCGLIVPLVAQVGLSDRESVGRQSGAMIGLFAGGWAASLLLVVPELLGLLSSTDMIVVSAAALLVGGTIIGFGKGLREWIPAGTATLLVVLLVLSGARGDALAGRMAVVRNPDAPRRLVEERPSALATYAVVENIRDGTRRLYRNGLTGAPSGHYELGYRLLGHLPALLHPGANRALVARFGTGSAASALAQHPQLKEIHVVAEEEAVFELAPAFARQNRNVLARKNVRRHVASLRPFLRDHPGAFDIITLEPAAADSLRGRLLHSTEFYAAARAALRQGGMLCQRLPVESFGPELLRRIVRSADEHFEFVTLWDFADGLFLLATSQAPKLEAQPLILRFSKVGLDLQKARVGDAMHLLASCLGTGPRFAPAGQVEPLHDRTRTEFAEVERGALRRFLAGITDADATAWAGDIYEGLDEAVARAQRLRTLLAEERIASEKLFELAEADRGDLRARAAAELRLYEERLDRRDFGGAARLPLVRDRTTALLGLVNSLEGDRRDYYSILLLREGVAVQATELERLAGTLEGSERRYVLNRARLLRNESAEEGEERLPDVELRDPTPALEAWDEDRLREDVLDAECANREQEFDAIVFDWFEKVGDQRRAVLMLHRAGWAQSVRAARKLAGRRNRDDLVALAPLFAGAYPEDRTWGRLCESDDARVRAAAAEAARAQGGAAHVATLIRLCADPQPAVRFGAFHSLEVILGEGAKQTGYDPESPDPAALEKLRALAR